jgi:hypothetical protein
MMSKFLIKKIVESQYGGNKNKIKVFNFYLLFENLLFEIDDLVKKLKSLSFEVYNGVEEIIIDEFDFLQKSGKQSVYKDGKLYVVNTKNLEETFASIVHELAHVIENYRRNDFFSDGLIKKEFLQKRLILYKILEDYFPEINLEKNYFLTINYNKIFDNFLVNEIGYGKLQTIAKKLFVSPYSIVSLSEYFACCFEKILCSSYEEEKYFKNLCPMVYNKITAML